MEPAQQFLDKWLEHNADLTRRQLESDLNALARKLAAIGKHGSGRHVIDAITLSNKCVTEFCRLSVDKASTLPDLPDGFTLVHERVAAFAASIVERVDKLAAKVAPGGLTDGLRREMRERQKPITTDLDREFDLAEMERRIGGYRPPRRTSWDAADKEKAATARDSKLSSHLHYLAAAVWVATRDEAAAENPQTAIERIEAMPGGWQNPDLAPFEQAVVARLIPVYGLTAERGWEPVPVAAFQPEPFSLGPSRLSHYGDLYVMAADLLALFPAMPAEQPVKSSPTETVEPTTAASDPSGKPDRKRLPDGVLNAWWQALGGDRDSIPIDDLWEFAKAAHPNHHISRERIRGLDPHRKPGPKGSAGN